MGVRTALDVVGQFLFGLPHTGRAGFEGLTVALLEAATDQKFRLSGSGPQSGQDARSEPNNTNVVKIEAKHYAKSSLDLRELHAELLQATASSPELDLWVLVTSCPVVDQQTAALELAAQKLEVELLVLDQGSSGLPRLSVLMAALPHVVRNWAAAHGHVKTDLDAALSELASYAQFETEKRQLISKLSGTLLGYEDARRRAAQRFREVVQDQGSAVSVFNQRVAVRSRESRRIRRVEVEDGLDTWWKSWPNALTQGVLLGEEGVGKSWAAVGWVSDNIDGDALPIILPFSGSAEAIGPDETLETLLPKLLVKWTGKGTVESWTRRWKKWLDAPRRQGPLALILADGLSERPALSWPSFFRTLNDKKWRTGVAVLATDRPAHWEPHCARAGLDHFQSMKVDGYTDGQLRLAVDGSGIDIRTIPGDLQELIRKPRYCDLVCRHFAEMQANSDFTVERLVLLDIRHRTESKRGPLTEDAFVEIIKNLAQKYRENPELSLSAIQSVVPMSDPDRRIYEEIVSGGFVARASGLNPKLTVERTRLIFGLGMLLADELRGVALQGRNRAELESELTSWFEPHPEMDVKVQICGSALFHSLLEDRYPSEARRELLRYWLTLRNWDDRAQSAFVDYVVRCPADFISVAVECWSSKRDLGAAQEFLTSAFLKHRDNPLVQPLLAEAVRSWMGFVHPAGLHSRGGSPERVEKTRQEIETRVGHPLSPGPLEMCGETLTVVEDYALMRLVRLGFLILSAGDRKPFLRCFASWAIASAVMGGPNDSPLADWVVRMSEEPIEELLSAQRAALLDRNDAVSRSAAYTLLWRIDPAQAERLRKNEPEYQTELWRFVTEQYEADPCRSLLPWADKDCFPCLERSDIHPVAALQKLGKRISEPNFHVPTSFVERTVAVLRFDPAKFRASVWSGEEDHFYENCTPLLASRAPHELASFVHRVVGTVSQRDFGQLYPVALWLPEVSPVLRKEEVEILLSVSEQLQQQASEETDAARLRDLWIAETFLLLAASPHLTPRELLERILGRPKDARDLSDFEHWFAGLSTAEVHEMFSILHSSTDEVTLKRVLWFLAGSPCELSEMDRNCLISLSEAADPVLSGLALRFICWSKDEGLGRLVVDPGRSFREELEQIYNLWGARVVVGHSGHVSFASVCERLSAASVGYALRARGFAPDEVKRYADLLNRCQQTIFSAPDPDNLVLPTIEIARNESEAGGVFPTFQNEPTSFKFKGSSATWATHRNRSQSSEDLEEWIKNFQDPQGHMENLNRRSLERVGAVAAAWKTDAFQWFGQDFSDSALQHVCKTHPETVKRWVENVLENEAGDELLTTRFATFFARVCPGLLEHDPPTGLRLWKHLYGERNSPVLFDAVNAAFSAPDNAATDEARWILIGNAFDDETISKISLLAELEGRQSWLRSAIERLLREAALGKKALGLALACFSNISVAEFDSYVEQANVGGSWVEEKVSTLREYVRENQFAQHWFEAYLSADDEEISWGALQMMLACGDHRFYVWRQGKEIRTAQGERRLRYLASRAREIEKSLDRSEKRKDVLFGIKTARGDVFPFLDRRSVRVS
jgi:hypothetical protein